MKIARAGLSKGIAPASNPDKIACRAVSTRWTKTQKAIAANAEYIDSQAGTTEKMGSNMAIADPITPGRDRPRMNRATRGSKAA